MGKQHGREEQKKYIEDPGAMMAKHLSMYGWVQAPVVILGFWLLTSPMVFRYGDAGMFWSDIISGVLVIAITAFSLKVKRYSWVGYANAVVALWLILSPLLFWATSPAAYMNSTLVGAFVFAFSFVIPMSMNMPGPEMPPGWSYNPSSWSQRAPLVALGLVGFFLSRAMAGYQLGYTNTVWEPFFSGTAGNGTETVLTSEVSKMFPVSDAGLGAATYLIEVLSTLMGDQRRWRTMPWMVAMFGLVVVPLGVTSIALVMMQPIVVGAWCTLCLISAAAMLLMVPLALDEVVAMIQFLHQSRKEGKPLWRAFIHGGSPLGAVDTPKPGRKESWTYSSMTWGLTCPPGQVLSIALGIWLLFSPSVFGSGEGAADNLFIVGASVITIAAIALAEVARSLRFLNTVLGAWLILSSFLFTGTGGNGAFWNSGFAGLLLVLLSLPLGQVRESYGTYQKWISWPRRRGRQTPVENDKIRAA